MNKENVIKKCYECNAVLGVLTANGLLVGDVLITSDICGNDSSTGFFRITCCKCGTVQKLRVEEHENGAIYSLGKA